MSDRQLGERCCGGIAPCVVHDRSALSRQRGREGGNRLAPAVEIRKARDPGRNGDWPAGRFNRRL